MHLLHVSYIPGAMLLAYVLQVYKKNLIKIWYTTIKLF